jgi:uncharacterized lipoprotein YmbA
MRRLMLGVMLGLGGCGGGGTTGTNYSEPPPMAEIVATPSPKASAVPAEAEVVENEAVEAELPTNEVTTDAASEDQADR